jgi:hypothetical protein
MYRMIIMRIGPHYLDREPCRQLIWADDPDRRFVARKGKGGRSAPGVAWCFA